MVWLAALILSNMTPEELAQEDKDMRIWYRNAKTGSKFIQWGFAICMAVGGAYIMCKTIINLNLPPLK